jgi:hypothetical protein
VVGNIFFYIFFLHDTSHVDLFWLLELVLLLLLDVLLNYCIDLSTRHVVLYLLGQFVEDTLVLDDNPQ